MKITEHQEVISYLVLIVIIVVILFVFMTVFTAYRNTWVPNENTTRLTYERCCGGNFCTDTYYNEELDLCVLTLCENSPFIDQKQCYYKPK